MLPLSQFAHFGRAENYRGDEYGNTVPIDKTQFGENNMTYIKK